MAPILLDEAIVKTFVFHNDGRLYEGLVLNHQLLKLVRYFSVGERGEAFALGWSLNNEGWSGIITASPRRYGVWVSVDAQVSCDNISLFSDAPSGEHEEDIRERLRPQPLL
ncbi:hypothetical protein [Vacuolonema iberomarrocanum]|uniref:hypothetical protein n=1 Tax=Vacuolonema iberomarrocanum TaxID=3454632 RepID=UPI0019FFFB99|nr:hypothetical protein [filamentous cyanobacterium LEGE 07170]